MSTTAPPETPPDAGGAALFDRSRYQALPKLDGHTATKVKLSFSGTVEIDTNDLDQLEHYRTLLLGDEVSLTVHAAVAKVGWGHDRKGVEEVKEVANQVTLKVHSYDIEGEEV